MRVVRSSSSVQVAKTMAGSAFLNQQPEKAFSEFVSHL